VKIKLNALPVFNLETQCVICGEEIDRRLYHYPIQGLLHRYFDFKGRGYGYCSDECLNIIRKTSKTVENLSKLLKIEERKLGLKTFRTT